MYCYKCGCELNKTDHCPNCGADVGTYKKIIYTSNYLYNDGLQKAQVRDLSGAILSLKNSLWYNKDNLDARNLLGLIYYEIGETVAALSEWVISKNINDERLHRKQNLGAEYLAQVQASKQTMENLDSSIERYNHALECCYTDNLDVAVLQLKKVLSVNPHYLRARQLLALLYIENKQYKRADRELQRCLLLDVNNTTTLRYRQEVLSKLQPEGTGQAGAQDVMRKANVRTVKTVGTGGEPRQSSGRNGKPKKPKVGSVIKYTADNETIIQPVNARNPGVDGFGVPSWIYGGAIGLIVGAALVAFLIMPTRIQSIRTDAQQQIREISSQSDTKDSQITDLQSQVDTLNADLKTLQDEQAKAEAEGGSSDKADLLMESAALYIEDSVKIKDAAEVLGKLDPETASDNMSDAFTKLYGDLYPLLRAQILQSYADSGIAAYEASKPDYETAAQDLETANKFENPDRLGQTWPMRQYYLADSYYQLYLAAQNGTSADTSSKSDDAKNDSAGSGSSKSDAAEDSSSGTASSESAADGSTASESTDTVSPEEYITKAKEVIANLAKTKPNSEYTTKANALLAQLPEVSANTGSQDAAGTAASTKTDTQDAAGTAGSTKTTAQTAAGTAGSTKTDTQDSE